MSKKTGPAFITLVALGMTPWRVAAQSGVPAPTPPAGAVAVATNVHDHRGVLIRLSMGLVYGTISTGDRTEDLKISGIGGGVNFGIGYSILPNLALTVDMFGPVMTAPTLKDGMSSVATSENVSAGWLAYGIGATYYVMPLNLYFGGSIGASTLFFEVEKDNVLVLSESDWGPAVQFLAGKEWWISDEWGLGMALQITLAHLPDGPFVWKGGSLALLLSATYN